MTEAQTLKETSERIANLAVTLEEAIDKLESHEIITGQRLKASEEYFNQRIVEIESSINDLREFMTETGVARLRVLTEKNLQESKEHLEEIRVATTKFKKIAEDGSKHLRQVAETSAKWIADSVKSLKVDEFRKLTFENTHRVEQASEKAIKKVSKLVKWFHWEKLGIALMVAVVASLMTGLFINDETPWEAHKQVVAERDAGKVLFKAWPQLSTTEKAHIEEAVTQFI